MKVALEIAYRVKIRPQLTFLLDNFNVISEKEGLENDRKTVLNGWCCLYLESCFREDLDRSYSTSKLRCLAVLIWL